MRLTVFLWLFYAAIMSVSAQKQDKGGWGIIAGINSANVTMSTNDGSISPKARTGFHIGACGEDYFFKKNENIFVYSAGMISMKGFGSGDNNTSMIYTEFDAHIGYKIPVNGTMNVLVSAGPYLAYGIGGKGKANGESYDSFADGSGMNRFDFGAGLKGGLEFANKFKILVGYDWGFLDVDNSDENITIRNRHLSVSLAYMFK